MKRYIIIFLINILTNLSYGQAKLQTDSTSGINLQPSPSLQWSRGSLHGKLLYYMFDAKTGKTFPVYTAQLVNSIFLGKDEAAGLYQSKGNYLTIETDPSVPSYAKTLTGFAAVRSSTDPLYLQGITGDVSVPSGGGFQQATLPSVNSNPGTVGSTSNSLTVQSDGKGRILSISASPTQITESQVNNLTSDLAGKQAALGFTPANINGSNVSGVWPVSITGNSSTVTNGLYSTGSYSNPSWLTSLAYSKLTGAPTDLGNFTNSTGYIKPLDAPALKGIYYADITGGGNSFEDYNTGGSYYKLFHDNSNSQEVYHITPGLSASTLTWNGDISATSFTGNLTGNVTGSLSGIASYANNAGSVNNGIYTTGSYANPSWLTSLAYSKLTGVPTNVSSFVNDAGYVTQSQTDAKYLQLTGSTFYNNIANTNTSVSDAYSYTVPSNSLTGNGSFIDGIYTGRLAEQENSVIQLKIYFGGQVCYFTPVINASSATGFDIHFYLYKTGTSTARVVAIYNDANFNSGIRQPSTDLSGIDFTVPNVLKATIVGGVSNDIILNTGFYRINKIN